MSLELESWSERLLARWRCPRTLTALIPLANETEPAVRSRLANLAPKLEQACAAVTGLHTFRLVVVPAGGADGRDGAGLRLLLNSVHDRPLAEHLADLTATTGDLLAAAFTGADFSGQPKDLAALIARCRVKESTFHLGAINQSVSDILAGQRLLETIESYADSRLNSGAWSPATPPESIRQDIRTFVLGQPSGLGLPRGALPDLAPGAKALRLFDLLLSFIFPALGVLAPHIVAAIRRIQSPVTRALAWTGFGLWWIYGALWSGLALVFVRVLEKIEPDQPTPEPDPAKVARIEATEDLHLKNAVTLWFTVRNTWTRRLLMKVILWGSERGCRHFWTAGALAEIDTIHYARVLRLNDNRTMLFMSDYDGSLDRYLMDFLGVGSSAVIPISSNAEGCPKTRWLFHPENLAVFGPGWRRMIRYYQLEMAVWYSAYPNLSVRDVLANAELRNGLFAEPMNAADAVAWLNRL